MRKVALLMLIVVSLILLINLNTVISWSINYFNNTLTNEEIDFTGNENVTRYIRIPRNVTFVTTADISVTDLNASGAWLEVGTPDGNREWAGNIGFNLDNVTAHFAFDDTNNVGNNSNGTLGPDYILNLGIGQNSLCTNCGSGSLEWNITPVGVLNYSNLNHEIIDFATGCGTTVRGCSICYWFNGTITDNDAVISISANPLTPNTNNFVWVSAGTAMRFDIYNSAGTQTWANQTLIGHDLDYPDLFCLLMNSSDGTHTYVELWSNITEVQNMSGSGWSSNDDIIHIGSNVGIYNAMSANVDIDELLFINHFLVPSEISDLYNSGLGNKPNLTTAEATGNIRTAINDYLDVCEWADNYCYINATFHSDKLSTINVTSMSFDNVGIVVEAEVYNTSAYETDSETFWINLSYDNDSYSSISANLVYNLTNYAGTQTGAGSNIEFTRTIDIPSVVNSVSKDFYWEVALVNSSGTHYENSTTHSQSIDVINFALCDDSYNIKFLNISFKDEDTDAHIDGRIDFEANYYLGSGTFIEKLDYDSSTTHNYNFTFCADPTNRTFYVNSTKLNWKNDTSYALRSSLINWILTNATTEQTLYLLDDADGQYVTFQVVSASDQPISDVNVLAQRTIDSTLTTVGNDNTDDAGSVTFWLNPDYTHTFTFTKSGYSTYTTSLKPTEDIYTITLSSSIEVNGTEFTRGIYYNIEPKDFVLINDTEYLFAFNITSDYFVLDSYGFVLLNSSDYYLDEASGTGEAGGNDAYVVVDTNGHERIKMEWYYYTNGTYINGTSSWRVGDFYEGEFSVKSIADDIQALIGTEGFNEFTLALIAIALTFIITGVLSYVSGIQSPLAIVGIICGLTALFDYLGFYKLINPEFMIGGDVVWNGEFFLTIIVSLIFLGYIFYEIREQRT